MAAFERLERLGMFRRNYLRAFRNMADELRARSNYELTETLRDREGWETARFGRLRLKWENRFKSPGTLESWDSRKRKNSSSSETKLTQQVFGHSNVPFFIPSLSSVLSTDGH
jgi:hypothetical protein